MIPTLIILIALVVILLCVVLLAVVRIEQLQAESDEDLEIDHAKCMSMVAAFVGDTFAARVLQSAAHDYGTTEGKARIAHIRWNVWVEDGPDIPTLWMLDRAETILAKTSHEPPED